MPLTDADERALASFQGGTTLQEYRILHELATQVTEGQIVEIGSFEGRSTIYIAKGVKQPNIKVWSVDPHVHGSADTLKKNIKKFNCGDIITSIVMKSHDAAEAYGERIGPIGFLFIDGDHSYEAAKDDFVSWGKRLVDNGAVAFHDCWGSGPTKVVAEMLGSGQYSNVHFRHTLLWATKRPASSKQRLKYRLFSILLLAISWVKMRLRPYKTMRKLEYYFGRIFKLRYLVPRL